MGVYFTVVLVFQDFNVNLSIWNKKIESPIHFMSLNLGGGSNSKYIKSLMRQQNPDVFLFQEAALNSIKKVFDASWQVQCDGGLCISSKYPYRKIGAFNRKMISGWGNFAVYYELNVNGKILPVMNLHLETPRHILSPLLNLHIDWRGIENFYDKKLLQTSLLNTWAMSQSSFVMSGDFNMTTSESLYKKRFSNVKNAFNLAGFGFNFTKYTAWHGVRIDHLLTSFNIDIISATTMPSLGGDHRAISVIIDLP